MENSMLGPKEDDPIWQSNNPQEPEEEEEEIQPADGIEPVRAEHFDATVDDTPDWMRDPKCKQCGRETEFLLANGRCRDCEHDNQMDAAEVQHGDD